jgi:hypothetical protein
MRRAVIAVLAVLACLAAAGPASAQAPDPDATIDVTVTCTSNQTMFRVLASGLNPGEPYGVLVENAEGTGVLSATGSDVSSPDGSIEAGFGSSLPSGTYTVYAYTGPYQNLADPSTWPGSIQVESFDPSLTTSFVSTTVQTNCGPGTKEDCKVDDGWQDAGYRNQGQCVSRFARL